MTSPTSCQILARARAAQPAWAALSVSRRCAILAAIRLEIARQSLDIAKLIADETTKPVLDALSGDVLVTLEQMRYYETHAGKILRRRRVSKSSLFYFGARFEEFFEPHGVALVIGPSNYPFQLCLLPLITALIAGNAVVLKCSERTPRTAAIIAGLCAGAHLPAGLVQVLHGEAAQSASLIDAQPDFIFFTGSSRNGLQVAEHAARQLIPTILELGGKDASLVFADCNLDRAIEGIAYGAFSNAGRVCVSIKRAYVETSIYEIFLNRLKERMGNLRVDASADADVFPLPEHALADFRAHIEDALTRGASLHSPQASSTMAGCPVLLTDVPAQARILTEECFGPALCVAPFRDEAEAIALANSGPFALGSSLWTRDLARARRIACRLNAGSCAINDVIRNIANPYAAFGGNKLSGYGRYHGPDGLRSLSRVKTVMIACDRRNREINWFPFANRTVNRLTALIRFRHGMTSLAARLCRTARPLLLIAAIPIALVANCALSPRTMF